MDSIDFIERSNLDDSEDNCFVAIALHEFGRYLILGVLTTIIIVFVAIIVRVVQIGQKTRTPAQRRMYVGPRARQSLSQSEPTIYVSPANLPPPPKYECLAPPSYEEVVGIHYPQYQVQPITQPITAAMAQSSSATNVVPEAPPTFISVTSETRVTSTQVAAS